MSMSSSIPKPKRGIRKSLRKGIEKIFDLAPNQTPPQQPSPGGASTARPPFPHPSPSLDATSSIASPVTSTPASIPASALAPAPVSAVTPASTPAPVPIPERVPTPASVPAPASAIAPENQPTQRANVTTGVWAGLDTALQVLHKSTVLLPPVQSAIDALLTCLDVMQQLSKNRKEDEEIMSELTSLANLLAEHMKQSTSARMSVAIASVAEGIEEQAKIIESRRSPGTGRRLLAADADEEELSKCYRRIGSLFRQLQADASLSTWSIVNDQMANTRLEGIAPAKLANYNSKLSTAISRRTCTAKTRTAILSGLNDWSHNAALADIYWMNGMAGTGKTTIACTFAESLDKRKQLAASFFCTRTSPECREASRIVPTVAYQLARYSVPFQSALCESLHQDPDVGAKDIVHQFERLLKEPLAEVREAIPGDLVVVIDALDECDDMIEVEQLLSILLQNAADLPLKFFVTSRPEPEIYDRMLARGQGYRTVLHLHEVERSLVQADIELYLEAELAFMSPTPVQIKELARLSGALFIYAATLVRYIQSRKSHVNPQQRLQSVISMASVPSKQYAAIDRLYMAVLQAALDDEELEPEEAGNMRCVLYSAICVQEPVSIETLTALAGLNDEWQTTAALQPLRPVLHISEANGLVSTLHASFPDFLLDKTRSGSYAFNLAMHHGLLANRCFEVMGSQLRFNICSLESSYVPDSKVENLDERVNQAISPALWYVCRYWGDHLRQAGNSDTLCAPLDDFLSSRLLFWMEVMNLKREMGTGVEMLFKLKAWLTTTVISGDITRHTEDALNFTASFAGNAVSQCTPHIYISSVPFCPKSSSVFMKYCKKLEGVVTVSGNAMQRVQTAELASWNVGLEVWSVSYSPDGRRVALGCEDGRVTIRSAFDGAVVAGSLEGHAGGIWSVAYSPDGTRIASGSGNNTIRIWNAHDGTLIAGPLAGHTREVWSVAYSPDGSHIVSGSRDTTVRVWNAHDGSLIAGPLKGHAGGVSSVAYSPDGTRVVSGSEDKTVRVWDTHDGTLVAGPLRGHTDSVSSVLYSPDGTRIVSGSHDKTIRLWSAQNDILAVGLLKGHTGSVLAIAYSPDSTRIISGSSDKTIRVWNAHDGTLVAGPLTGHRTSVWSVACSPDGTRIVSGSRDNTIRVWNAHDGTLAAASPPESHTDRVFSVSYSPDGTRILSGPGHKPSRMWNAHDGTLVAGPLEDPTDQVQPLAYSPDGTCIVTGSWAKSIRVQRAQDGTLVIGPLEGHTRGVRSAAYSPDGTRIVSGASDKTLRVWDAYNGTLIAGPLKGHTDSVQSVAYSPDGTRIVSGSSDKTIRVWNADDGTLVAGPLEGHTSSIWSVVYSPDGTRIASGSLDNTIRLWNVHDDTPAVGLIEGHTDSIRAVAFSPDNTRIVSSSSDKTIRVWNVRDNALVASPLEPGINSVHLDTTDGWIMGGNSELLFWMPPELRFASILPDLRCLLVIAPVGSLAIDYGGVLLGKNWHQCYKP